MPQSPESVGTFRWLDLEMPAWQPLRGMLAEPLPIDFATAEQRLGALPLMFFEPDGYFLWGRGSGVERWQINGQLTDDGQQMLYITARGRMPRQPFEQFLTVFGWPDVPLAIQLVVEGVMIAAADFLAAME